MTRFRDALQGVNGLRGRDIYAACGQLKHTTELVQITA
jgi:adenine C2-methylase RlmN of 23S rRNA A2503 and tRNA A37